MNTEEKLLKLKKLADAMYYAAQYLTTDASRLHKAMDEYHQFIIHEYHKEEPTIPDIVDEHWWEMLGEEAVSEDLKKCTSKIIFEGTNFNKSWYAHPELAFKAGAKWQFERVNEALLSEVLPCFMHGGEADEVVAKLDEVLNQK